MEIRQNVLRITELKVVDQNNGDMYARFVLNDKEYEVLNFNVVMASDEEGKPVFEMRGDVQSREDLNESVLHEAFNVFCHELQKFMEEFAKRDAKKEMEERSSDESEKPKT